MKRMPTDRERGETLMGLMVGLAVGLVVLAAGSAMLAKHLGHHHATLQDSHLHHDLRSAVHWMSRELRKAQYTALAWQQRAPERCDAPFCQDGLDFSIQGDQIDFSHDRNHNGLREDNECMGFRLVDGALQARRSCLGHGSWQAISDRANLRITALRWHLQCQAHSGWLERTLRMDLTAQWPADASRRLSLSHTIALRNGVPASQQARFCP